MTYLSFEGETTNQSIFKLIDDIASKNDDAVVYLDCSGGSVSTVTYFVDFTERYEKSITLVSNWGMLSSGFDLFLMSKTKKVVKESCYGMCHLSYRSVTTTELIQKEKAEMWYLKDVEDSNKRRGDFYKSIGFTPSMMKDYYAGIDIHIIPEQMKKLAIKAEKLWNL